MATISAYDPNKPYRGSSHKADGIELVPGAPGYNAEAAAPYHAKIAQTGAITPLNTTGGAPVLPITPQSAPVYNLGPETSVATRVNDILGEKSPLMERAKTLGLGIASDRGMLNSGKIASEAVTGKMMDYALPMASQDAQLWGTAALQSQGNQETIDRMGQEYKYNSSLMNQQSQAQYFSDKLLKQMDIDANRYIQELDIDEKTKAQLAVTASEMSQQYYNSWAAIMTAPNLSEESKLAYADALKTRFMNDLKFQGDVMGIEINLDQFPVTSDFPVGTIQTPPVTPSVDTNQNAFVPRWNMDNFVQMANK